MDDAAIKIEQLKKWRSSRKRDLRIDTAMNVFCRSLKKTNKQLVQIQEAWNELVPHQYHAVAIPIAFRGGILDVVVDGSPTAYQVTHANHHFELGRKLDYGTYRQHIRKPAFVWIVYFVQLFLGTFLYILLIPPLAFRTASVRSRLVIIAEFCVLFTIAVFLFRALSPETLLLYWFYPLVVCSFLTNIRGLASHALNDVENLYLSSRTIKSSKWVSWLFMHENYHLEHHVFPSAPSYNLGKTHELIWDRLPEGLYSRSYSVLLSWFLLAAFRNDLNPLGIVRPGHEGDV